MGAGPGGARRGAPAAGRPLAGLSPDEMAAARRERPAARAAAAGSAGAPAPGSAGAPAPQPRGAWLRAGLRLSAGSGAAGLVAAVKLLLGAPAACQKAARQNPRGEQVFLLQCPCKD